MQSVARDPETSDSTDDDRSELVRGTESGWVRPATRMPRDRQSWGRSAAIALRSQLRAPFSAVVVGLALSWLAFTPSLLPRSPVFQGVVVAFVAVIGYGTGALLGWIVRSCGGRLTGRLRQRAWRVTGVIGLLGTILVAWSYGRWENALRAQVGVDPIGLGDVLTTLLIALALVAVMLAVSRLLKAAGRRVARLVERLLPARVATVIGGLVVAAVAYLLVAGVVTDRLLGTLDATFMAINDEFTTDLPAPTSLSLSAGPDSGETWERLGRQGRVFISNAPTAGTIAAFTGRPAKQPVRAYIGVSTDGDIELAQEAQRAVDELERLGGLDRAVLNVATGTGRGWVNENQARALEYMWGGDTATVSMQYSYLPSWMSFLVDGDRAQDAGRLLFEAVYARWLELPVGSRPKLVVSGESLGSFGGEAAFSGAQDLATRTDGALFVGPTNNNQLWSHFTAERDRGTPEVLPLYDAGAIVRFADRPQDWDTPGPWPGTRVGYLQHANDPITWWNWSLAVQRPDWLSEPRGRAVSPAIHWIPGLTMVQLAADQLVANDVPAGQGHQFGQEPVYAWAEILPPAGWSDADTTRLAVEIKNQRVLDVE